MASDKGHHTGRDPAHQNPSEGQADPTTPPYAGQLQHQAPAPLMVGPTPGELCRTQAPTTAGSGDLQPKFDEEAYAPLWCKMSVLLSLILGSATSLGERQDQVPGAPPSSIWRPSPPSNFSFPQMHRPGSPSSTLESARPSTPTGSKFSTSIFAFDPATSAALAGDI